MSPEQQPRLTSMRSDLRSASAITYHPVCNDSFQSRVKVDLTGPAGMRYIPVGMNERATGPSGRRRPRIRAPEATRDKLLAAAFEEIYRRGFQAASLDTILARAGVTKGALYHHFPDKAALGYAVVDEVVRGLLLERWLSPLQRSTGDPLAALQVTLRRRAAKLTAEEVELGCPLNNLAQEMSPLDEGFRRRVDATFEAWRGGFARALTRGQESGTVRRDVNPRKVAAFLVAGAEGAYGLAKSARSRAMLRSNLETLATFLDGLRPPATSTPSARCDVSFPYDPETGQAKTNLTP
jgi:TetR/AcrR family transcriptional regulator, transcriptional repressor for nem operon